MMTQSEANRENCAKSACIIDAHMMDTALVTNLIQLP